ncbi:Phosphoribosyl transferase domain-containing protein [Gaiella occulta]|uniref:Phosphoribosyl transferase domain-containing protein n=1 Tax=Gaiella occulta TaxID=1002870 RepID=A0A7M2YYA1_9ACTN|nr:phosphoribosyltransferase family protein [Gaiella occulta]RDI74448.1 Phosphoribosyl transferase domain-containing protein [Gaiella occulta]
MAISGDPKTRFRDRREAGRLLAERLTDLRDEQPLVLGLVRGGVPVAFEVASALEAPLDVLVVRKLGAPRQPEYAIGAIAEDGTCVVDWDAAAPLGLGAAQVNRLIARESIEVRRRVARYREGRTPLDVTGRTVVVVDDGVATGLTDLVAVRAAHRAGARKIVVAVPVCAAPSMARLRREAADVVCVIAPRVLGGVGRWYDDFSQVDDDEVVALLAASAERTGKAKVEEVVVETDGVRLPGDLRRVEQPRGIVLFAHGSGSSRRSPRNVEVAAALGNAGFATLLFDLLTVEETRDRANVFDIPLLGARLAAATRWARARPRLSSLALGYFGASTGAAAALSAAAQLPGEVAAVVCRGGRPDLAAEALAAVRAPTLLIVGGGDPQVLELNRGALAALRCERELAVVPGAGHLFAEPGALEEVARLACAWFLEHLAAGASPPESRTGDG